MSLAEFHGLLQKAEVQLCSAFLKSAFSECWTLCGQHVWTLFFWTLDFACQQTFWIESQVCDLFRVMYDCRSWWHLDLSFSLSLSVSISILLGIHWKPMVLMQYEGLRLANISSCVLCVWPTVNLLRAWVSQICMKVFVDFLDMCDYSLPQKNREVMRSGTDGAFKNW